MKLLKLFLTLGLSLILYSPVFSQAFSDNASDQSAISEEQQSGSESQLPLVQHVKKRYLGSGKDIHFFEGHKTVNKQDKFEKSILVNDGDLTIAGRVQGKAVAINGNIRLHASAVVTSDVISINGKIYREHGARIKGEMVETVIRTQLYSNKSSRMRSSELPKKYKVSVESPYENEGETWTRSYNWPKKNRSENWRRTYKTRTRHNHMINDDHFVYRYNRVEGLFLGANVPAVDNFESEMVNLDFNGFFGYGFATEEWRYRGNVELWLFGKHGPVLGMTAYNLTDSDDEWIIPTEENSLAAFLIREDFQDYFQREGFGIYAREYISSSFDVTFGYFEDDFSSLERNTNWSLFGGDKRFRHNPLIEPGQMKSYKAGFKLDTRDDDDSPFSGWLISGSAMWNKSSLANDFDYDRFILDVRRYIPLRRGENFDIRLRAGSSRGNMPYQHNFYLGGISTLRGFNYKDFSGNRMVLANFEYRIGDKSRRFSNNWVIDPLNLVLFFDSGLAWFAGETSKYNKGFDQLTWNQLHSNIGVALTDDEGRVRLNFAKSVDAGQSDIIVTFRINRAF
ncbi:MAG: hypothetical protein DWQ05_04300 [Calditrichaeota bacterium]|nr:MAG: hypothetical protein DWQ05_04300 [Calditrichota bacterium]